MAHELEDRERRLRFLSDNLPDGMIYQVRFHPDGRRQFTYVSAGVEKLHGISVAEVLANPQALYGQILEEDRDRVAAAESEAARTMTVFSEEVRVRTREGGARWSHLCSEPVREADGGILWNGMELDITRRKSAETALRESEERLKEAQRVASIGSWELDIERNQLAWSDEIYRIFEIDPGRFQASYEAFLAAIHPEDRDAVNDAYSRSLKERTPYAITHRLLMQDGRVKHVEERCETEFSPDGRPLVSRGTVQDITEKRKTEEALVRSERLAAVGKLASGIAHEFNNILAIVRIESQMLEMDPAVAAHPAALARLATIDEQTERGRQVAAGIMALARPVPPRMERTRVLEMVERVLTVQRTALLAENIQVRVAIPEDLVVMADSGRIQQVLLNLVLNARDAMRTTQGGSLTLAASIADDGREARLRVADRGTGMSREVMDQIFTPFFTTKGAYANGEPHLKGNGLGLAVSYSIMQEHGGRITVESALGSGSAFTLCFPLESGASAPAGGIA